MYLQKARHLLRLLGRDRDMHELVLQGVDEYIRVREDEGAHGGTVYKEIVALRQALEWGRASQAASKLPALPAEAGRASVVPRAPRSPRRPAVPATIVGVDRRRRRRKPRALANAGLLHLQ
jgi:hypothetical protein